MRTQLGLCSVDCPIFPALTSQQWPVKAQAARAVGTVASKLASNIQPETQARLVHMLLAGLEGRTWAGKESLVRSLADVVKAAPEILRSSMAEEERDKLVAVLLRESRKDKTEYKVVALESTGTVLKELKVDRFKEVYDIVGGYLPQPRKEGEEEEEENKEVEEEDPESGARQLELQQSALVCVGLAWPESRDTADTFLPVLLDQLDQLTTQTTRRNQLALIKCLALILTVWTVPEDAAVSSTVASIFTRLASIICALLQIPKYVQLRTETLRVLGLAVKLLTGAARPPLVEAFRSDVIASLDGVIKDLGSDPATKTTARDLKTALTSLEGRDQN